MTDSTTPTPPNQPLPLPETPPGRTVASRSPSEHADLPVLDTPVLGTEAATTDHGRRRRLPLLIAVAGAAALVLIGVGVAWAMGADGTQAEPQAKTPFASARDKCGSGALTGESELGDQGKTLTLRGQGKESSGLSYSTLECYWSELDMPDSVKAEVEATRALDGRQTGDWGDIHASWSYHPDSGLQMVLTHAN
ncbi:hypothetical protein [Micromonospora sp. 4G55]|uniref:hypothetical protein n=1 Tax=Micromonospora sp. 4G55 TaxID=2806102 RepID=UPI001A53422C|nr:hypothetical protein [Micromonospora sp. 4G55]MBM0255690.1 hypothetical protein [Micromonospora sp. 4G55]